MEFIRSLHTVRSSEACGWNVSMPLRWMLNLNSGSGNFFACELQKGRRSWGRRLCVSWKHVGQILSGENISHHRVGEEKLWMSDGHFCTPQDCTLNIPVLQDDPAVWALPVGCGGSRHSHFGLTFLLSRFWTFSPLGTMSYHDGDAVSWWWGCCLLVFLLKPRG